MGDAFDHEDGGVTIEPDAVGGSTQSFAVGGEQPDYNVELQLPDRTVKIPVSEGEGVALENEVGQPFAVLTVTDADK